VQAQEHSVSLRLDRRGRAPPARRGCRWRCSSAWRCGFPRRRPTRRSSPNSVSPAPRRVADVAVQGGFVLGSRRCADW